MKVIVPTILLFMQAASGLAAPFAEKISALVARQNSQKLYESPDGSGDITIDFGDGKVNYGERLPSSILDVIRDSCTDTACKPGADYGFTSFVVDGGRGMDRSFTINVEGIFNTPGQPGSKDDLLEIAKLAFQEVYNAGVATHTTDAWYVTGECPPNQVNGCLTQGGETTEQWESVDHVAVQIGQKHLNVGIKMNDNSAGTGVCEALSAAAAGMGLANAAAGFAGGVLAIGCGLVKEV